MAETVPKITIKELRARHNLTQAQFARKYWYYSSNG